MGQSISRRDFLKSAGFGAAGVGAAGLVGMIANDRGIGKAYAADTFNFADTIAWNAIYDVVVVGFGGAGGIASIYAADNGAQVLLCDVAPAGQEGGNTRFAAQLILGGTDPDGIYSYLKEGLAWHFDVDEESLRVYADGVYGMKDLLGYLGVDDPYLLTMNGASATPEYPEVPGAESIVKWLVHEGMYDSALWQVISENVMERLDAIDVWYESPVTKLIQDPQSHTVVGVQIERGGETILVRATNGVVLSCGGFEVNKEMIQNYLGAPRLAPFGTLWNNGDGIRMGIEVGADLWHMDGYESLGILANNTWAVEEGERAFLEKALQGPVPVLSLASGLYGTGSVILVGDDGGRFIDENAPSRHGRVYTCGVWRNPIANWAPHLVFDETKYQELKANGYITEERDAKLFKASSPEELAGMIGADPEILAGTIADFNSFAQNGRDIKFERDSGSLTAFDGTAYYAAEFGPVILNTQGGPRRDKDAQVLDTHGEPIPHLYSAGELGGITVFQYNGGGNLAECMIFGKIAGINAAAEKDPLVDFEVPAPVEDAIMYEPGAMDDASAQQ